MPLDGFHFDMRVAALDHMISKLSQPSSWTKDRERRINHNGEVSMCVIGAMRDARTTGLDFKSRDLEIAMLETIHHHVPRRYNFFGRLLTRWMPGIAIADFNDDPHTTQWQVVRMLVMTRDKLLEKARAMA